MNNSSNQQNYDYIFKYILVGDSSVGKTSILNRFLNGNFDPNNQFTIGVQFGQKIIVANRHFIKLQVWDTAGQQQFRSMTRSYYRSSAAALVVFDCTRIETYRNAKRWIQQIKSNGHKQIILILIGNKIDLINERTVSRVQALKLANQYNMVYIQTSAKMQQNIQQCFVRPTINVLNKIDHGIIIIGKQQNGIKVKKTQKNQKTNKCCQC